MATVTRNTKYPVSDYQQWVAADITIGDVLGVYESLGNRSAHSVTIESLGGTTQVRFNVVQKIYKQYSPLHESWVGLGHGAVRPDGKLIGETKVAKATITIDPDQAQTWTANEIAVVDIEVLAKAPNLRITVT